MRGAIEVLKSIRKIRNIGVLASLLSLPFLYSCNNTNHEKMDCVSTNYESMLESKIQPLEGVIDECAKKYNLKKNFFRAIIAADLEYIPVPFVQDNKEFVKNHLSNYMKAKSNGGRTRDIFRSYLNNYGIVDDHEIDSYIDRVFSFNNSFNTNDAWQILFQKNKAKYGDLEGIMLSPEQEVKTNSKLDPYNGLIAGSASNNGLKKNLLKAKIAVDAKSVKPGELDFEKLIDYEVERLREELTNAKSDKYAALALTLYACDYGSIKSVVNNGKCLFDFLPSIRDGKLVKCYLEDVLMNESAFNNKNRVSDGERFHYKTVIIDPGHGAGEKGPDHFYDSTGTVFDGTVKQRFYKNNSIFNGEVKTQKTKLNNGSVRTEYFDAVTGEKLGKIDYVKADDESQKVYPGDVGTVYKGLHEDKLNWEGSKIIYDALQELVQKNVGLENVVLTRGENQFLPINQRVRIARQYDPNSSIFISIHHNSPRSIEDQSTPLAIYSGLFGDIPDMFQGFDWDYGYTQFNTQSVVSNIGSAISDFFGGLIGGGSSPVYEENNDCRESNAPYQISHMMNKILDGLSDAGMGRGCIVSDHNLGRETSNGGAFNLGVLKGTYDYNMDALLIEVNDISNINTIKYLKRDPYFKKAVANAFINSMYR